MDQHPLIQYIKEAKSQNASTEEILKALGDAGWHAHDVLELVLEHTKIKPSAQKPVTQENIISVRDLSKSYKNLKALDNLNLDIAKGTVTAFLGPNGAGKTTFIRILTTLLEADSGMVSIAGLDPVKDADKLRSIIGVTGQYAAIDEILTGRENLEMVARLYHLNPSEAKTRAQELLERFDLADAADRSLRTYSGGMRRRLDLAASLVIKPQILFLDEPTTGLDPRSRFELWHIIRDLVSDGTTVILTTQYLEEADQLAEKIFVIDLGKIIAEGTPDELKKKVGGDMVELHMEQHGTVAEVAKVIEKYGAGIATTDPGTGMVTMPIEGGATVLVNIVRDLDKANLKLKDVMLRRPSLDDVFMKLTGHATEDKNKNQISTTR